MFFRTLGSVAGKTGSVEYMECPLLNESSCLLTETSSVFVVTAYNPLSWPVSTALRLPVFAPHYQVTDANGNHSPDIVISADLQYYDAKRISVEDGC